MTWLSFQRSELPSGQGTIAGSMARIALQRPSSPLERGRDFELVLGEEGLVVVEVLRDRVGRDAVVLAVILERGQPALGEVLLEAARRCAVLGDVEREAVAHQPRRILAGPVEEHVGRFRPRERHLDGGLVGLVRKLLEDDVHVRMGLLVLRRRHGDVLRIPHIGEVPHLDVDRLSRADGGGGEPERESAAQRKAQQSSRQFMHGFSSQRSCRQWRTIPPFSIPPNRFVIASCQRLRVHRTGSILTC